MPDDLELDLDPLERATRKPRKPKKKKKKKKKHKKHKGKKPATAPPPRPAPPTPVPPPEPGAILDAASLHVLNRFTGGWTPALEMQVRTAGGIGAWFERQLDGSVPDAFYSASAVWWPATTASTATLVQRQSDDIEPIWEAVANYERWCLVRRIHSERQVLEAMTAFWEHHLHVPAEADAAQYFRASYGRTIRSLALTSFEQLLRATITHPAMGAYLGNAVSTKKAPNENLGRELLELHTVGRDAGYTEDDVKASARILTGYRVDVWNTWAVSYDPASHWTGPVTVLGFSHANTAPDGQAVTAAYLSYLARHPATARRIARKLAVRFVSDTPSTALVEQLAQTYLAHDTAVVPVIRELVASAEFQASAGAKLRTPEEDVVATYRALDVRVTAPAVDDAAAQAILWQTMDLGLRPFGWPRPDGRPDRTGAWTSVSRMLGSFELHQAMAGRWWPTKGIAYPTPQQLLPEASMRFDALVDHLSRRVLGRPATPLLHTAAGQAVGCSPGTIIDADHAVIRWQMPNLLTVFLDTLTHMTR